MNKNNPTVYIVLTVYNWEKYFLEQLMSIYFQEYENRFLIIVDDWSTDSSYDIAQNFVRDYNLENKVNIIKQENKGTCKATEKWLIEVQELGKEDDYVTYCDADDIWCRNKLWYLVEYMRNNKDCDLCFHDIAVLNQDWIIISKSFLYSRSFQHSNLNNNNFFELCLGNHISINLIYNIKYINDIIPIENEWAKDYRTALIFSINNRNIDFIEEKLGYYRKWHQSIQKKLHWNWTLKPMERDLDLLNKLKKRFPEKKEINYFIKYWEFRISWIKKWYPRLSLILSRLLFPRRFLLSTRNLIKYYIYRNYKNK